MIRFIKKLLLKIKGIKLNLSKNIILLNTNIAYHKNIEVRGNLFINKFCSILAGKNSKIIFLGDCLIGPGCIITSANHSTKRNNNFFKQIWKEKNVIIGEEVWIGGNVTILPGVKIAKGTIIGAGSVVTKTIKKEYSIIGGVPAKLIKMRN